MKVTFELTTEQMYKVVFITLTISHYTSFGWRLFHTSERDKEIKALSVVFALLALIYVVMIIAE